MQYRSFFIVFFLLIPIGCQSPRFSDYAHYCASARYRFEVPSDFRGNLEINENFLLDSPVDPFCMTSEEEKELLRSKISPPSLLYSSETKG